MAQWKSVWGTSPLIWLQSLDPVVKGQHWLTPAVLWLPHAAMACTCMHTTIIIFKGQWNGSAGRSACKKALWPEFASQIPQGGRREDTLTVVLWPLRLLWHVYVCSHTIHVFMCVDTHVSVYYTCMWFSSGSHAYVARALITEPSLTQVVFFKCKSSEHAWQIHM